MIAKHGCGAQWVQVASRTAHCAGLECHRTFASEKAFQAHRTEGKCLDPAMLLRKDGRPRFETFTDRAGCEVWRSTDRMSDASRAKLRAS
jgi:hypothetical protein